MFYIKNSSHQFAEVLDGTRITSVSCGPYHVVALDSENFVYAWGYCKGGGLGLGVKIVLRFDRKVNHHCSKLNLFVALQLDPSPCQLITFQSTHLKGRLWS